MQNFPGAFVLGQKDTKTPGALLLFNNCLSILHLIKTYPTHSPPARTVCAPFDSQRLAKRLV